ncbi:MAG: AAA family ATPase [Acidimicrobiia bacterium]|nr:AAA family ATPase [Acidimicrobiia bacterium]
MAGEHQPVADGPEAETQVHKGTAGQKDAPRTRRKSQPWDRLKILVLLGFFMAFMLSAKINAPFTSVQEAIAEMWSETFGRFLIIGSFVEILRQIHYWAGERSARYNGFWRESVLGGVERQTEKRLSPWTRFRLGRYIRITVFLLIIGAIFDYFVADVTGPAEALIQAPRILARNMQQFIFIMFAPLYLIIQFGALFWFLSRGGMEVIMPEEIKTRYEDVWGQDHVLELVRENVGFLEKPDEIEAKGGYIPGGILLWGPPGTGKTLIAEATAGEVGVPFVFVEPGAFINMFFGVGILKVKSLFRKLRKLSLRNGGVVVFFDEADALGSRGSLSQGQFGQPMDAFGAAIGTCNGFSYLSSGSQRLIFDDFVAQSTLDPEDSGAGKPRRIIMGGGGGGGGGMGTLQALLTEISGLTKPRGLSNRIRKSLGMRPKAPPKYRIFIMMASNMPQALDEALLRPGRIDRIYRVGYPSREGRIATLNGYLDKVDHQLTEDEITGLAVKTPYYSGAKIKDLVNEALILAMRDDREIITWNDIWKAKLLKELGPSERTEYIDRERHAIAVHESCHAVIAHLMLSDQEIDMATIQRHSSALGMVKPIQMEDRVTRWKTEYEGEIMTSIASLVGERMFFDGDNSSGVSSDLQNATRLAAYMHGVYGMGDAVSSLAVMAAGRYGTPDPSPDVIKRRGKGVEAILQRLYEETHALLDEYREKVLAVAAALEDRKTLSGSEISEIMGSEPGVLGHGRTGTWRMIDPNRALEAAGLLEEPAAATAANMSEINDITDD